MCVSLQTHVAGTGGKCGFQLVPATMEKRVLQLPAPEQSHLLQAVDLGLLGQWGADARVPRGVTVSLQPSPAPVHTSSGVAAWDPPALTGTGAPRPAVGSWG